MQKHVTQKTVLALAIASLFSGVSHAQETVATDPAASTALGSNGPAYATAHLTADAAMRRWDDVLRSLTQHVRL